MAPSCTAAAISCILLVPLPVASTALTSPNAKPNATSAITAATMTYVGLLPVRDSSPLAASKLRDMCCPPVPKYGHAEAVRPPANLGEMILTFTIDATGNLGCGNDAGRTVAVRYGRTQSRRHALPGRRGSRGVLRHFSGVHSLKGVTISTRRACISYPLYAIVVDRRF